MLYGKIFRDLYLAEEVKSVSFVFCVARLTPT